MPIESADLTFVFQGAAGAATRPGLDDAIRKARLLAPGCKVIVSTTAGTATEGIDADSLVFSDDVGALPNLKSGGFPNNINRQIQSTRAGLAKVETRYAVKIRSDCSVSALDFVRAYLDQAALAGTEPIVFCSLFTIDPLIFEQMPFHLSDWFQFSTTEQLRSYWACPFMTEEDATHYLRHPYAANSNFFDRLFLSRWAVEQHMSVHYAAALGYATPAHHNDTAPPVLDAFNRFLAERAVILDPAQIGLGFDKYAWAFVSPFQNLNCISHLDWQVIRDRHYGAAGDAASLPARARRIANKRRALRIFRLVAPFGRLLYLRAFRVFINRTLRLLAR